MPHVSCRDVASGIVAAMALDLSDMRDAQERSVTIRGYRVYYRGPFEWSWYGLRTLLVIDIRYGVKRLGPVGWWKVPQ